MAKAKEEKVVRSAEQIALRKAAKKKRKRERRVERRAEKAAGLVALPAEDINKDKFPDVAASRDVLRGPVVARNDGLKFARAHYSLSPTRVSTQPLKTHPAIPQLADDAFDGDKDVLNNSFTNNRSPDALTNERLEFELSVTDKPIRNPAYSPSAMSIFENDDNFIFDCELPVADQSIRNPAISPSAMPIFENEANLILGDHTRYVAATKIPPKASTDVRTSKSVQEVSFAGVIGTSNLPAPAKPSVQRSKPLFWSSEDEGIEQFKANQPSKPLSDKIALKSIPGGPSTDSIGTSDLSAPARPRVQGSKPRPFIWSSEDEGIESFIASHSWKPSSGTNTDDDDEDHISAPSPILSKLFPASTEPKVGKSSLDMKSRNPFLSGWFPDRGSRTGESSTGPNLVENEIEKKGHGRCSDLELGEDSGIEETIITKGAKAMLSIPSNTLPKTHLQAFDLSEGADNSGDSEMEADDEMSDEEEISDDEQMYDGAPSSDAREPRKIMPANHAGFPAPAPNPHDREPRKIMPARHAGFPAPEDLPKWFPTNIKKIYQVDRHGGALSFKELNEITRYRAVLEKIRRQKWKTYLVAGEARWKLQKVVRRLRSHPLTKAFYQYRKKQYEVWKEKALKSWKRLEKTHHGISILDETIDINVRQEGMIYCGIAKKLGHRL